MKNLYVVCNDFHEGEESVCCVCGSEWKAEEKIEEYKNNFAQAETRIPIFWIRKISTDMGESDCFQFE